jgi:hypothetical protein
MLHAKAARQSNGQLQWHYADRGAETDVEAVLGENVLGGKRRECMLQDWHHFSIEFRSHNGLPRVGFAYCCMLVWSGSWVAPSKVQAAPNDDVSGCIHRPVASPAWPGEAGNGMFSGQKHMAAKKSPAGSQSR